MPFETLPQPYQQRRTAASPSLPPPAEPVEISDVVVSAHRQGDHSEEANLEWDDSGILADDILHFVDNFSWSEHIVVYNPTKVLV